MNWSINESLFSAQWPIFKNKGYNKGLLYYINQFNSNYYLSVKRKTPSSLSLTNMSNLRRDNFSAWKPKRRGLRRYKCFQLPFVFCLPLNGNLVSAVLKCIRCSTSEMLTRSYPQLWSVLIFNECHKHFLQSDTSSNATVTHQKAKNKLHSRLGHKGFIFVFMGISGNPSIRLTDWMCFLSSITVTDMWPAPVPGASISRQRSAGGPSPTLCWRRCTCPSQR